MAKQMDAFSAALMADKREIIFAPTVYKFDTFAAMAEEFKLNEREIGRASCRERVCQYV